MRPIVKTININFRLHCPCVLFSNCATRTPQGGKTLPSFILTSKSTAPKFSAEEEEELGRYFLGSEKPRWDEKEEESGERQGGGGASYVINCRPGRTCQQIIPFDEEEEEDERDNEVEEKEEEEEERWREERPKRKGFSDRVDYAFGGGGRSWEDDDSDEFYSSRQVTKIINLHQIVRYLINCFCSWRDGGSWENAVESDQEVSSALEQRIKERNRIREREKPQAFSSNSYYGQKRPFRPRPPPQTTTSYSTNRPYHYSRWPSLPVTSAPFHFQVRFFLPMSHISPYPSQSIVIFISSISAAHESPVATTEQVSIGIEAEVELRPLRVPPGQEAKEQAEQVEAAAAGKAAATTATAAATAAKVAAAEPAQDGSTVA